MPNEPEARQALPEELCFAALKHYEYVAMKACHWNNQIPQAIEFWYLGKPKLEARIADVNNSVFGSHSFFMEPSCVVQIEKMKSLSNTQYQELERLRVEVANLRNIVAKLVRPH